MKINTKFDDPIVSIVGAAVLILIGFPMLFNGNPYGGYSSPAPFS